MHIQVNGAAIYCYTGGKAFDAAQPTVVFIHGVLNDHSVWALQSRYMANHGWNVLAVDLPGHCRSGGDAPASVEQGAAFVAALLDALGIERAALIGHSSTSAARLSSQIPASTSLPVAVVRLPSRNTGRCACPAVANPVHRATTSSTTPTVATMPRWAWPRSTHCGPRGFWCLIRA